jgi:hypothetical protein
VFCAKVNDVHKINNVGRKFFIMAYLDCCSQESYY